MKNTAMLRSCATRGLAAFVTTLLGCVWLADAQQGVTYSLPQSVVDIKATKETLTVVAPAPDLSKVKTETTANVAYEVTLRSVADPAQTYELSQTPGFWKSKDMEVKLTSAGLLAGFNASSKGEAGPIVLGFIRGLASIVALAAGDATRAPGAPWPPPVDECRAVRVDSQTLDIQALVKRTAGGCALWRGLSTNRTEQEEWQQRLANARKALELAGPGSFAQRLAVVKEYEGHVTALTEARAAMEKELEAALKAFRTLHGLGEEKTTETRVFQFDFAEIPGEDKWEEVRAAAESTDAPSSYVRMVALLRWCSVGITESAIGTVKNPDQGGGGGQRSDDIIVHYRRPRPIRITTWKGTRKKEGEATVWSPDQVSVAHLFDTKDSPLELRMPLSAWSERKLEMEFDSAGQPLRVKASSSATGTAISTTVASAVSDAAGAYKASLGQILEVKKAKNALQTEDLSAQLGVLKQKKEILDARVAEEGALSTAEDRLRKQTIDSQIERLQSEIRLRQTEDTFDLKVEIEVLKAQIEQLTQQIALIKAQRDAKP